MISCVKRVVMTLYTSMYIVYTQARLFKDDLWILISCWQRIRENQRGTIPAKPTLNNLCHRMRSCLSSLVSFSIFVCNYILRLGFGGCSSESINWLVRDFQGGKIPLQTCHLHFSFSSILIFSRIKPGFANMPNYHICQMYFYET